MCRCCGEGIFRIIDLLLGLALVVLLIALNGLFVAGEFSLLAVAAVHVRVPAATGRARSVDALLKRLSFHLGGAQLGITLTSLVLGVVAEDTIGSLLGQIGGPFVHGTALVGAAAIALAAALQMAFGELAPKNLAVSRPRQTSAALASVLRLYGVLVAPVVLLFNGIANRIVRILGLQPTEELRVVRTREELEQVLRSSRAGTLDDDSARLLGRSLRLAGKVAADALLPRTAMDTLPIDATVADLARAASQKGHSRFPVIDTDVDDVAGLVDVRDVFRVAGGSQRESAPLADVLRPVLVVGEQLALDRVLAEMERSGDRLAVVVDEHGGTAGLVTREDIFEEALGNLEDEHDRPLRPLAQELSREQQPLAQRKLSGSLTLGEASEALEEMAARAAAGGIEGRRLGLSPPDGPYETLAGFVVWLAGVIPEVGDTVVWEGWSFEVAARDGLRVAELVVAPIAQSASGPQSASSSGMGIGSGCA